MRRSRWNVTRAETITILVHRPLGSDSFFSFYYRLLVSDPSAIPGLEQVRSGKVDVQVGVLRATVDEFCWD